MYMRILGISLMLIGHPGGVNASEYTEKHGTSSHSHIKQHMVLFPFPEKADVLKFLDSQFDGNLFPGKFNFQDKKFLDMVDSYSGLYVNQEAIAFFVKSLEPYYRKNFEERIGEIPTKMSKGIDYAIARKQDGLLKYFYNKFKSSKTEKDAYDYFSRVAALMHKESLEQLNARAIFKRVAKL